MLLKLVPLRIKLLLQHFLTPSFLRYLIIGFSTFALEFGLYWAFVNLVGMRYIWASISEFPILFAFNFFGHKYFTFQNSHAARKQLVHYVMLVIANGIVSNALLYIFVDFLGIHYILGKFLTIVLIIMWNFLALGKFVYRGFSE